MNTWYKTIIFYKMHPYSGTGWKDWAKILLEGRTDVYIFPPGAGISVLDIALLPYVHACSSEIKVLSPGLIIYQGVDPLVMRNIGASYKVTIFYKMHPYSDRGWKDWARIFLDDRTDIHILPRGAVTGTRDCILTLYVHLFFTYLDFDSVFIHNSYMLIEGQ